MRIAPCGLLRRCTRLRAGPSGGDGGVVLPAGTFSASPLDHCLLGCIAALVAFYMLRHNALVGTAASVAVVAALAYYGRPLLSI